MSEHEYRLIAGGWLLLILFLAFFWYATLRRLSEILKGRLASTRSHQSVSGVIGIILFLFRAEFKQTGDERLINLCLRLRQLLYGYLGSIGAYIVFLVIMRPRF